MAGAKPKLTPAQAQAQAKKRMKERERKAKERQVRLAKKGKAGIITKRAARINQANK